jgi:hypothetical protein
MRAPLEDFFAKRAALFAIRVAKTFSSADRRVGASFGILECARPTGYFWKRARNKTIFLRSNMHARPVEAA